ncbi:MAG: type I restriction endonuclease subunit R, partial [Methanosarcinales archaeon]
MFKEKTLIEEFIIKRLIEKGWQYVPADELEKESFEEPLLVSNLIKSILKINKKLKITDEEVNQVLNELRLAGTGIEGAKKILNFYKWGVPVKFEKEKIVQNIQLFDFEHIENNEFVVTNQVIYQGRERIRNDIILYVNGIPFVNIECKDPTKPGVSWFDAFKQIKDYEHIVPELYKYVQIGVAVESKAKYFPIVSWLSVNEVRTYEWKEENKDSIDSLIDMLSKNVFLDIIKNFLFYRVERGNATKVITRYMQYRSSNKIVERVKRNIKGEEEKNKGLIWHWQGSGKTLTMIFSANKLYFLEELENPTIFFIVDRIELEDQLNSEFNSLYIVRPEIIDSVRELEEVLSFDDYKGKRGVFIVLIHKFRPQELKDVQEVIEKISENRETIMTRENVIAFIDEGHRTQYGILASQMRSILKNAFYFAFTGTPISKRGKDTYLQFSNPPDEYYLDRYFITDSIKDGFTVKIVYQPRLEKDVHLKKEELEAFLESEFEEIPEEIKEEVEEKVRKKLNYIKLFLEDEARIKVIAEDIANHFKENFDGKFKGMVVAGSRKACVIYENELAKYFPDEYFKVVMTESERETDPLLARHVAETKEKYGFKDISDIRKDIIIKFKEEEFPRILIVTDMLLTGFDAPILQVMYLDKPLKEHRLLQAIARTNRPFKDLK